MLSLNQIIEKQEGKKIPTTHSAHEKSFIFLHSTGMRLDPEDFLLEIFRELFYKSRYEGDGKVKNLTPDLLDTREEKLLLYAFSGRSLQSSSKEVFTAVYPILVKNSQFRKEAERTIKYFLFSGPIAQYFKNHTFDDSKNKLKHEFCKLTFQALMGHNSCDTIKAQSDKEILSCLSIHGDNQKVLKEDEVIDKILELIDDTNTNSFYLKCDGSKYNDEISKRIFFDINYLFKLEKKIDRSEWINYFKTYLRVTLPIWMLSQARILIYVHEMIFSGCLDNEILCKKIAERNKKLFYPSSTPNNSALDIIENYTKKRVELEILLHLYSKFKADYFKNNGVTKYFTLDKVGADCITVADFAKEIKNNEQELCLFLKVDEGISLHQAIMRLSENYDAWRNPLKHSIGKNMNEFLRVLRVSEGNFEGALLKYNKAGNKVKGFIVFPGPNLIRLFTILVKEKNPDKKILLEDLESHFEQYGIDFSESDEARKRLINELLKLGLLKGSPDAGKSAQISSPY